MKSIAVTAGGLLLFATGCVQSVHPPYTKETLTDEPPLAGTWGAVSFKENKATSEPDAERTTYALKRLGKGHYDLHIEKGKKNRPPTNLFQQGRDECYFDVHVFKLGEALYLDAVRDVADDEGPTLHALPLHTVFRIDVDKSGLRLRGMDAAALRKRLAKSQTDHIENDTLLRPVVTAPTSAVEKFLKEHGDAVFTKNVSHFLKKLERK